MDIQCCNRSQRLLTGIDNVPVVFLHVLWVCIRPHHTTSCRVTANSINMTFFFSKTAAWLDVKLRGHYELANIWRPLYCEKCAQLPQCAESASGSVTFRLIIAVIFNWWFWCFFRGQTALSMCDCVVTCACRPSFGYTGIWEAVLRMWLLGKYMALDH